MENVPPDNVHLVNHGFLLEKFLSPDQVSVKALHAAYNPQNKRPVIGVISRLTEWKGVHFIIPAFKRLLSDYPDALIIIANAKGDYEAEIKKRDDNAYDPALYHQKKEGIVDELMKMFEDKFTVTREDFFLMIIN
jgi:glycosyltransferase involved in cell wall biosynthesis